MSLHDIAQQLAARGRNGDTVLVHMTPGEVGGLQALAMAHGGSLTQNPDTGLPEANFLKSLLPMLAGGALTVLSGGALSPLMAAGIVGGGTALATRNIGQGLIAGLGAFGGAGLGSAIAGLGASGAAAAAGVPGAAQANLAAEQAAMGMSSPVGATAATPSMSQNFMTGAQTAMRNPSSLISGLGGAKGAATTLGMAALPALAATPEQTVPTTTKQPEIPPYQFRYDTRLNPRAMQDPFDTSRERRWFGPVSGMAKGGPARVEDDPNFTMTGASADMFRYLMGQGARPAAPAAPVPGAFDNIKPVGMRTFDFTGQPEGTGPNAMTPPASAVAGLPSAASSVAPPAAPTRGVMPQIIIDPVTGDPVLADQYVAPENRAPTGLAAIYAANPWMRGMDASAGPGSFGGSMGGPAGAGEVGFGMGAGEMAYARGGRLLQGDGDGVSDSIPGSIEGKQPVRVATGEFIFDARTVSEIGNGDTKAGAKKLYAVMDAVHKRRKQAQRGEPSGADRELRKLLA